MTDQAQKIWEDAFHAWDRSRNGFSPTGDEAEAIAVIDRALVEMVPGDIAGELAATLQLLIEAWPEDKLSPIGELITRADFALGALIKHVKTAALEIA